MAAAPRYTLLDASGRPYLSAIKGAIGGHRGLKIYGRLNCASALRFIAAGKYVKFRVFFANVMTAIAAGYRPCGVCLRDSFVVWRDDRASWMRLVAEARQELSAPKAVARGGKATDLGASTPNSPKARPQQPKPRRQKSRK